MDKPPPKLIHALPERQSFEIRYPRVTRYSAQIRNRVTVDWESVPPLRLEPERIPPEVEMRGLSVNNEGRMSLSGPGAVSEADLGQFRAANRVQSLTFEMAAALTREYLNDNPETLPAHVLFPQLQRIVARYVEECVEVVPPAQRIDLFLAPYYGWVVERLVQAIRPDTSEGEAAEIARYDESRPEGTTADVRFWTTRTIYPVNKSHLNGVVSDTTMWEQSAAYRIDRCPAVAAFAKNAGLGFEVPYVHDHAPHVYVPDFLIRMTSGRMLILEVKGFDPLTEVKEAAARALDGGGQRRGRSRPLGLCLRQLAGGRDAGTGSVQRRLTAESPARGTARRPAGAALHRQRRRLRLRPGGCAQLLFDLGPLAFRTGRLVRGAEDQRLEGVVALAADIFVQRHRISP